jgi:hypothetical protein
MSGYKKRHSPLKRVLTPVLLCLVAPRQPHALTIKGIFRIAIAIPTFIPRSELDPPDAPRCTTWQVLSAGGQSPRRPLGHCSLSDYRHSVRSRMLNLGVHMFSRSRQERRGQFGAVSARNSAKLSETNVSANESGNRTCDAVHYREGRLVRQGDERSTSIRALTRRSCYRQWGAG